MVTWSVPIFIQRVQMNEAKLRKICTKAKCNLQDLGVIQIVFNHFIVLESHDHLKDLRRQSLFADFV